MKISVIIATCNAEKYLEETLETVLNQTINDYEVIVVNDGSTDNTLEILEKYEQNYSYLNIISKENGGPSSARNMGLEHAKGEYIYFLDADDILELDALECLYARAEKEQADLVIANYDIFNEMKVIPVNDLNMLLKEKEIDKYNTTILNTFALWNKLFRRDVIETSGLRFPPISYSEDGVFVMNYVYQTKKIVGLDKIVIHYRRMQGGTAITASLTKSKVEDYIKAHKMILDITEDQFLKENPGYSTIEEAKTYKPEIKKYLNAIVMKELRILLRQFYTKFWHMEEETIKLVVEEIEEKLNRLDMKEISKLQKLNLEYSVFSLWKEKNTCLNDAYITAVLFCDSTRAGEFLKCLKTISAQILVPLKIIVPSFMREYIEKNGERKDNMVFIDADSENELFHFALERTTSDYIIFCNQRFLYSSDLFARAYRYLKKVNIDFYSEVVCHNEYGVSQPMTISRIMYNKFKHSKEYNEYIYMDYLFANKFFKVKFLKRLLIHKSDFLLDNLPMIFKKAYYIIKDNNSVLFDGSEEEYTEYIKNLGSSDFIDNYLYDGKVTLNDHDITRTAGEALSKLVIHPHKGRLDNIVKKSMVIFKNMPLKNRVLFYSVRKDGDLEGNAKALYPHINGKKAVFAKLNPHNHLKQIQGLQMVMTSKVIVTDDYVRYLKHFPLRPEQRVIQLWHACGAFKKFGQRGTNMSLEMDRATHAQYNLVCVSGQAVRNIYADAFDVDIRKVRALGCPRTDAFFDEEQILKTKQKVYNEYPELKDKYVIIYAPTFRDVGSDRTIFEPELDFDIVSKALLPNQKLIICPHPLMKNEIISKKYPNIQVVRDFSTNDMMFVSDMLITDYSSVIFEYALLRKPIVFYCYDLQTYDRGFYLRYPEDLPGEICKTQSELINFLSTPEKHTVTEKHTVFVEKYMSGCDGHSCERIAGIINSYIGEKIWKSKE